MNSSAPPGTVFTAGFAGPLEFHGFEAIEQLSPAWDHAHSQLGRGDARVRVTVAQTPRMELAVVSRSPGVLVRGSPPRGMAVLGLCLEGPTVHLQRIAWGWERVAVLPRGAEFEIISATPHTIFELCVDAGRLRDEAAARWGPRFDLSGSAPCLRFGDRASRERALATWGRVLASARSQPEALADAAFAERLEDEALDAVLDGVEPERPAAPPRRRREVALRAEAFLRRSLDEPIRLEDVCAATRASRQTLHASFRSVFGISPMAYSRSLRLSQARSDLERAGRGTTVATVAVKWGFFRLGHFSVDYREMFGEKPSETLHRARGPKAPRPAGANQARERPLPEELAPEEQPAAPHRAGRILEVT